VVAAEFLPLVRRGLRARHPGEGVHDQPVVGEGEVVVSGGSGMSAVGVHRAMRRRHLDAWTLWATYVSLGGTAAFPEVAAALAGTAVLTSEQTELLVQSLNP
jgi:hypothetical protein